ncbi:family 16 glycosylhydrolase [Nocardioides sp. SYSU D00038]|uniref:glycoside hydrolase family 16 protein n=1 Tax=Nocardioides sp. SYSU D00038 TaxID=2812554 RepID=UPI0019684C84|nr:glycoside hydrolase family 16 protein [Nocardioides sp. SYSU D00038]
MARPPRPGRPLPLRLPHRLPHRALALLAALLLGAVLLSACGSDDEVEAGAACGPEPLEEDGRIWDCVLDEDFDGTVLDTSVWSIVSSAETGYRNGPECYRGDAGDNVEVADGELRLTATQEDEEFTCPSINGGFKSRYVGAFVSTFGKLAVRYARVEIRAAFPESTKPGTHSALWLYPDPQVEQGKASGELDIGEYYSYVSNRVNAAAYYKRAVGTSPVLSGCRVADPEEFHTYFLVWDEDKIRVLYDGEPCLEHDIEPASDTRAEPFGSPYAVNLLQALSPNGTMNQLDPDDSPLPGTMRIDYVRVWEASCGSGSTQGAALRSAEEPELPEEPGGESAEPSEEPCPDGTDEG